MWLCIFWRVNWGHMLKLILEINRTFANNATLHWFWRVIWGCIWKLTLEINLNFENNDKYANNMLYEQGSHEIRGAFFTDSNELDPAVVTERSKFGLKKVFFVVWAILIMFSQNLSLFWPGLEIGFVQFPSQNPCEKLETSLSARHVWESCLCRKRNHLDGRWELSKMFSSFFLGNFCRSHYCKNLCQIGEVGDFIHSDRYNEMKNRCSILFFVEKLRKCIQFWRRTVSFVRGHGQAAHMPHKLCADAGCAEVSVWDIQVLSFIVK